MGTRTGTEHIPVLLDEALDILLQGTDQTYVDATFGRGGHSRAMLARLGPGAKVVALDRDPQAVAAGSILAAEDERLSIHHAPFSRLREILQSLGIDQVAGVLMDLGVSSPQLDDPERGFSFMADGPLDMRMDPTQGVSAAEWLNEAAESEIAAVLRDFGDERFSRRIARSIVAARPLTTTAQLARAVADSVPKPRGAAKHPATRSFQAIRIFVNDEMGELQRGLQAGFAALEPGGRLAVITFHSLEDRTVKRWFKERSSPPQLPRRVPVRYDSARAEARIIAGPVRPGPAELARNPRSRSATLRVLAKEQSNG